MKFLTFLFSLFIFLGSFFASAEKNYLSEKIYDSLIQPVFVAKCQECHGPDKSKGKLKLHTKKDLLKGGAGAGSEIIVKGSTDDSELIYRITLPADDEEAMPPMDDKEHYNPITAQELIVIKEWIKLGASFDLLVSDLNEDSVKSAIHVFKNMPKKIISKSIALQPKLPSVSVADPIALEKIRKAGILAMPIAQNTNAIYVNASYAGKKFTDNNLKLLEPISAQLLWINLARTGITDDGIASLANHKLLTRLHLENTSISDSSSIHISKLPNLEYLNLYGTNLTDASLNNLRKLKKLKKIFLWKTKITEKGAQNFKRQYVNVDKFDSLITQKKSLQISFNSLVRSEQEKVKKLENIAEKLAIETNDTKNINELCPVTQKQTVLNKFSVFEGRRIGFCCDKCKVKFDKDGAVFRNKIAGFTASNAYRMAYDNLQNAQKLMDQSIEKVNSEIRAVSIELKKMGPEINLGWKDNLVSN
jgi:hypothetical protein